MAKKIIGKIRLCPNTVAWSNMDMNIFLSKARRKEMPVHEDCDMDVIMKAVEEGLVEFVEMKQEPVKKEEPKKRTRQAAKKQEAKIDVEVKDTSEKEDKPE